MSRPSATSILKFERCYSSQYLSDTTTPALGRPSPPPEPTARNKPLRAIMLPTLRQKRVSQVTLFAGSLSTRLSSTRPRLFVGSNRNRGETQVRFYAQQPPSGSGFPGFSFQQQRNKGDTLKEFVGPSLFRYTTLIRRRVSTSLSWQGTVN